MGKGSAITELAAADQLKPSRVCDHHLSGSASAGTPHACAANKERPWPDLSNGAEDAPFDKAHEAAIFELWDVCAGLEQLQLATCQVHQVRGPALEAIKDVSGLHRPADSDAATAVQPDNFAERSNAVLVPMAIS